MIPFRTDEAPARFPLVTLCLLLVNAAVFAWEWSVGWSDAGPLSALALVPADLLADPFAVAKVTVAERVFAVPEAATLITHAFLHGSLAHLLGNMVYLWAFGGAVESRVGHLRFGVLYVAWGVCAAAAHMAADPHSAVPMVGASGAISGVLGAFLVFHPLTRVRSLFFIWVFPTVVRLPSIIFLGLWVGMQVLYARCPGHGPSNVAYLAHLGGFAAGLVSGILLRIIEPSPQRASRRSTT